MRQTGLGRVRANCRECSGSNICMHDSLIVHCPICDPLGYQCGILRFKMWGGAMTVQDVRSPNKKDVIEHLNCTMDAFLRHIEAQFTDEMDWDNYANVWEYDHIEPIRLKTDTEEGEDLLKKRLARLCYKNVRPCLVRENRIYGNKDKETCTKNTT